MPTDNDRRIALITGATAGLGAEFARRLAERGHSLILVARNTERLAEQSAELARAHGIEVETIAVDLATDAGVDHVVARLGQLPPINVLVNNAGFGTNGALARGDGAVQDAMVRLHVLAVHRLTQAALPAMLEAGRGSIITVSSVASYLTSAGNVNYCATKAYQRVAMEALSLEVGGQGVYVQALCPGLTRTEFHQRASMRMDRVPDVVWMSAAAVVDASLRAMDARRPTVVIPGFKNRAILALLRLLPQRLMAVGAKMRSRHELDARDH